MRKFISTKIDEASPINRTLQRILLRNVGERDMPVNEAMLIAQDQDYVHISGIPKVVDLRGNRLVKNVKDIKKKKKKTNESEDPENENNNEDMPNLEGQCIGESSNWQEKHVQKNLNK
jgi:hypothetical protein